jgi:glycosyltransferase involved in cell wall biosynthesis
MQNIKISKTKSNILHLISSSFMGGPEKQIINSSKKLRDEFKIIHSSFIEDSTDNEFLEISRKFGFRTAVFHSRGAIDFKSILNIRRYLKKTNIDILCLHGYKPIVIGTIAAMGTSTKVVSFSRGFTTENAKVAIYEWLERTALNFAAGVIAVSKSQAEKLKKMGLKNRKLHVVYNAVTSEILDHNKQINSTYTLRKSLGIPSESKIVMTAGRLSPEKGHKTFIEAIKYNKSKYTNVYYLILGDGMCRDELEEMARHYEIDKFCLFLGFQHDIHKYYNLCDLFVLPSYTEALPNVILEAFVLSKPVLCTNVGGIPEIVINNKSGCIVEPMDHEALAKEMERMIFNDKLLASYGQCGREFVIRNFNPENQSNNLKNIFYSIL